MTPHILALDLSLRRTGWCAGGQTGVINTEKLRGMERIDSIVRRVQSLARDADLVVLEGYSYGSQGCAVVNIGELGGAVRLLLYRLGVPFVAVEPSRLKVFATGKGNVGKDAMIAEAVRRFDFKGSDNNEADAFLLWWMARVGYGEKLALPVKQAAAAGKVEWPTLGAVA